MSQITTGLMVRIKKSRLRNMGVHMKIFNKSEGDNSLELNNNTNLINQNQWKQSRGLDAET